jgi:5,6-dimethylbenzimidazole synthase
MSGPSGSPPVFDDAFRDELRRLMAWRRDVRRFRPDPIDPALVETILSAADLAPSVGDSRPSRFIQADAAARARVRKNFERCNAEALAQYEGERAALYARLKLEGLEIAPVQFAVFSDHSVARGQGLGRRTMPQTLDYSVVTAITMVWLAARAEGVGMGWVSILDPAGVEAELAVPKDWRFIAWLCVGRPVEEHDDPELQRAGWTPAV